MKKHPRQFATGGFTLLELVIAAVCVGILSVGSLTYQYNTMRDVRRAETAATASRLAKMILEHWKGLAGTADYDPAEVFAEELLITPSQAGPDPAEADGTALTLLGHYRVHMNNAFYFVTCSWRPATATEPLLLNIAVGWRVDYADDVLDSNSNELRFSVYCIP